MNDNNISKNDKNHDELEQLLIDLHQSDNNYNEKQRQQQLQQFPIMAFVISTSIVSGIMIITLPFITIQLTMKQTIPFMATPKHKIKDALLYIQKHSYNKRQQQQQMMKLRNTNMINNTTNSDENIIDSRATFCQKQQQQHRHNQFLDLGSGDGETIYQALQIVNTAEKVIPSSGTGTIDSHDSYNNTNEYYFTSCIGIELNTTLYAYSYIRRLMFWKHQQQVRSKFICRNIFPKISSSSITAKKLLLSDNNNNKNNNHHISNNTKYDDHYSMIIQQSNVIMIFGIPSLMVPFSQLLMNNKCQPGTYIICYRFPLPVANNSNANDWNNECTTNAATATSRTTFTTKTTTAMNNKSEVDQHMPDRGKYNGSSSGNNSISSLLTARVIYNKDELRIYECLDTESVSTSI